MKEFLVLRAFEVTNQDLSTQIKNAGSPHAFGFIPKGTILNEDQFDSLTEAERYFVQFTGVPSEPIEQKPIVEEPKAEPVVETPEETPEASTETPLDSTEEANLEELRKQYEELFGEKPHSLKKAKSLQDDIDSKLGEPAKTSEGTQL